jgi:hypothetical protein
MADASKIGWNESLNLLKADSAIASKGGRPAGGPVRRLRRLPEDAWPAAST